MPNRITVHRPRSYRSAAQRKAAVDQRRGSAHQRGYTKRWARYSADRLKRYPWCAQHLKRKPARYVTAVCTDHIVPVEGPEDPLFWDDTNHQSLCKTCHGEKTVREDGGFGNAKLHREARS